MFRKKKNRNWNKKRILLEKIWVRREKGESWSDCNTGVARNRWKIGVWDWIWEEFISIGCASFEDRWSALRILSPSIFTLEEWAEWAEKKKREKKRRRGKKCEKWWWKSWIEKKIKLFHRKRRNIIGNEKYWQSLWLGSCESWRLKNQINEELIGKQNLRIEISQMIVRSTF